jgi:beta-fructofuranosidase
MLFPFRIVIACLVTLFLAPLGACGESTDEAIARATAAIAAAAPRAQADPARPIFHVTAPAQWINDPNGPIFFKGFYHLFYQLSPFSDQGGPRYWGHVRSRDLAKWETQPIALAPATEAGEAEVWSGCCTVNGSGDPMIFYTSIAAGKSPQDHAEQWAAIGDRDLLQWHRSPANPVLSEALHEGVKIFDWRDPFIFRDGKQTFLVTGGNLNRAQGGQAVVNIYEAQNAGLTQWKYRGVLFHNPDPEARTAECPNFFKLGDAWVLFMSPYGKVQYFVGDFDAKACRFKPLTRGLVDSGPNFYAPNTMQLSDGRRLVWGWVTGLPGGHGWNGCLSLPRLLSLSPTGQLQESPAPQLNKLRGQPMQWHHVSLEHGERTFPLPRTNAMEILAEIDLHAAKSVELRIKSAAGTASPIVVNLSGSELQVMDAKNTLQLSEGKRELKLRIFIDRSVLEVFANETVCVTKVIPPMDPDAILQIHADNAGATARLIQSWPMKTVW